MTNRLDNVAHDHGFDPPPLHPNALGTPWENKEIEARVVELWTDHSATQISAVLLKEFEIEVTKSSILGKIRRLGLGATTKTKLSFYARNLGQAGSRSPSKKRKALPVIEAPPMFFTEPLRITFAQLETKSCRYICQDGPDWLFCGLDQKPGSSYCWHHHPLIWQRPESRRAA